MNQTYCVLRHYQFLYVVISKWSLRNKVCQKDLYCYFILELHFTLSWSSEFAQSKQDLITLSPLIHLSFCIIQNEKPTINFKLLAFTLLCEIGFLIYDLPLFVPCRTFCEHRKKERIETRDTEEYTSNISYSSPAQICPASKTCE